MRARGHEVIMVVSKGGGLVPRARAKGFTVYELSFKKRGALWALLKLISLLTRHKIDIINTHSSKDAWLGGIVGRLLKKKIVRTRHLSTPIRAGLNSRLLYNTLADFVVTTSQAIVPIIRVQAALPAARIRSIPTGVEPFTVNPREVAAFRSTLGLTAQDILVGTVCFVRSWKGIEDFMRAAHLLKAVKHLKWVIIGGGYLENYTPKLDELSLREVLTFTGHLDSPYAAIAALDIFALLSTAHEGVSQASLQAAYLEKPLITTTVGGLPEVCLDQETGLHVPCFSPHKVAEAVLQLKQAEAERLAMGVRAKQLVLSKFTFQNTLNQMEEVLCTPVRCTPR